MVYAVGPGVKARRGFARLGHRRHVTAAGGLVREVQCFCGVRLGALAYYSSNGKMFYRPVHGLLRGEDGIIRPYPDGYAAPRREAAAESTRPWLASASAAAAEVFEVEDETVIVWAYQVADDPLIVSHERQHEMPPHLAVIVQSMVRDAEM